MAQNFSKVDRLIKEEDSTEILRKMDLHRDLLLDAVRMGQAARANVTLNHPRTSRGYYAYAECNAGLSEKLIALGWTRRDVDNIPILIHPNGAYQIVVSSGDLATGTALESARPSTQRQKGVKFSALFGGNSRDLFDLPANEILQMTKIEGLCPTWILLYYFDEGKSETRAELSLPTAMDRAQVASSDKQCISDWETRIILGSVGGEPDLPPESPDFTDEDDFEVIPISKQ